ncbi:ankyrin repeat and SOCS box protein 7-like [Branchiostoma floridae]|uniref:Ankyrin repeat and SOCS box protein 7-like n=1 Tax=Branchiostoma floridae TaxID=7739 RepID=A0A9J7MHV8_BRAFL|nr:ankyrin repeat and SOCS box protein 7-like [Branchiostoma floridae]
MPKLRPRKSGKHATCSQDALKLQEAVRGGKLAPVKSLLQKGLSVNQRCVYGFSLLHGAVVNSQLRCVRLLLEHGACAYVKDYTGGYTPLHFAAKYVLTRIAQVILQYDDSERVVNARGRDGLTPLHIVAACGKEECALQFMRLLLESGAIIDPVTDFGFTPLLMAIKFRRYSCIKMLVEWGANVDLEMGLPIRYAVANNDHKLLRILLQNGAKCNYGGPKTGQTPLHLAAMQNNVVLATRLWEYGADCNAKNQSEETPLEVARSVADEDTQCVQFLRDVTYKARSLQDLCRLTVRSQVGHKRLHRLDELDITRVMLNYLKHKH